MTAVRVEWIVLGSGLLASEPNANVVERLVGDAEKLTVTSTATTSGDRPSAPAGAQFARLTAFDGPVIVAWGDDPTASQTNGMVLSDGMTDVVPAESGTLLSFVEMT